MNKNDFIFKMAMVGIIALVMIIPLALIRSVVSEREQLQKESIVNISSSWAKPQCLNGPILRYRFTKTEVDADNKPTKKTVTRKVFPAILKYQVETNTETLHRSIYEVSVYTSDLVIRGEFRRPEEMACAEDLQLSMSVSDLRGIVGGIFADLGGKRYEFVASTDQRSESTSSLSDLHGGSAIVSKVSVEPDADIIPFEIRMKLRGSESMMFVPIGNLTEVEMRSNCTTPSFYGDFLPSERNITDSGFEASWVVSQINRGAPESSEFGVKMLQSVTQYQQTTRAAKYGILIVALVFLAGFLVEMLTHKGINLLQYVVIGLSLVLFYMLLLSFSEFMPFWLSFMLAALMTTLALTGYFRGILRTKTAYFLGGFVALAYTASYIMMQMETYAMLAGSLLLFICLCAVMYFTRNGNQFKFTEE